MPVVAGIVEIHSGVVLARNRAWGPGIFSVITGFLESGETPQEGICRETTEELGLKPEDPELVGFYPFTKKNQIIIAYHVPATGNITLSEELVEHKIIPRTLLKGWHFGTGLAVTDWLNKIRQSQSGEAP